MIDLATGKAVRVKTSDVSPSQLLVQIGRVANHVAREAIVPCGECTTCCWYERTDVFPEKERPEDLAHLTMEQDEQGWFLAHRKDGACIHLGECGGCTIHAHRPEVCRAYDCRPFGLAGLAPQSVPGHRVPSWEFPIQSPLDRAIMLAAHQAAVPYQEACLNGTAPPDTNAMAAVLQSIVENLPRAKAVIAAFDALPEEDRLRAQAAMAEADREFEERTRTRWARVGLEDQ